MRRMKWESIQTDSKQIQGSGENPRMLIRGEETRCSEKSTPAKSGQAEASKPRPIPGRCSDNNMAEVRFFYFTPGINSRKGKETSATFQIASFMVFTGTWPTTDRGLFTKVILQRRPQKSLPKRTWELNRRTRVQPCKTCPSHSVSSVSPQMAAVEEMTAYRKQSPRSQSNHGERSRVKKCINDSIPQFTWVASQGLG